MTYWCAGLITGAAIGFVGGVWLSRKVIVRRVAQLMAPIPPEFFRHAPHPAAVRSN